MSKRHELTEADLYEIFVSKYGHPSTAGWSPKRRFSFKYHPPGDIYEATIKKLVNQNTRWIDVGGGRSLFPNNAPLSELLSQKCEKVVAVDPSQNVSENPYVHEKVMCMFEDYITDQKFDLATIRMVAEHINNPEAVLVKLTEVLNPNGLVVIYTINKFSPIPIITYLTPFSFHHKIKKFFWGGEEKDTFPVAYKMNTRKELFRLFSCYNFSEEAFYYLDDLSAFFRFKTLNLLELLLWKGLKSLNMKYPENNLLGIYKYTA